MQIHQLLQNRGTLSVIDYKPGAAKISPQMGTSCAWGQVSRRDFSNRYTSMLTGHLDGRQSLGEIAQDQFLAFDFRCEAGLLALQSPQEANGPGAPVGSLRADGALGLAKRQVILLDP